MSGDVHVKIDGLADTNSSGVSLEALYTFSAVYILYFTTVQQGLLKDFSQRGGRGQI